MKSKNKHLVRVEKGYGPRHAMNAQEGSEAVPSALPDPGAQMGENYAGMALRALRDQVLPADVREEIMRNPTGAKALATYASLGIMLMPEHGGPELGKMGKSAVPAETWLSFKKVKGSEIGQVHGDVRVDPAGNHFELVGSHLTDDGTWHGIVKQVEAPGSEQEPGAAPWQSEISQIEKEHPLPPSEKSSLAQLQQDTAYEPPPEEPPLEGKASQELPDFRQKWIMRDWLRRNPGPPIPPDQTQFGSKFEPPPEEEPPFEPNVPRYRKGKTKVGVAKGFGPRHAENAKEGDLTQVNTDTVPAMLTPREAVLNRNAAELAGRGNIEQLNQEGNVLAKKGVDLAAKGESDVAGQVNLPLRPGGFSNQLIQWMKENPDDPEAERLRKVLYRVDPDLAAAKGVASVPVVKPPKAVTDNLLKYVLPGAIRREATAGIPKGVAKGTSDMKSKPKQSKPSGYAGGSPYAQGYQKLQGGGDVPFKPAGSVQSGDINPNVLAGQNLKQGQLNYWNRYGQLPPGLGGPPSPPQAGGSTDPYGSGQPWGLPQAGPSGNDPYGSRGLTPAGSDVSTDPYAGGLTPYGGGGGWNPTGFDPQTRAYGGGTSPGWNPTQYDPQLQAYGNLNQAGKKAWNPGGGGFYPQGQGFASGTQDVPGGIGTPNPQAAYSKDQVDFKAPDLSGFLKAIQEEAQKRGISQSQMAEIAKQFSGMGGGGGSPGGGSLPYDQLGGQYASFTGGTPGGYQGGISDIGYPPFLMPNAEYHADKGSTWEGPYDPNYLVQRYAGGTSAVPGYQEGVDRVLHLPGSISPWDLSDSNPFGNFSGGRNVRALQEGPNYQGMYGGNMLGAPSVQPPGWSLSGPTRSPTTWSYQGPTYGWTAQALPADPDQPLAGVNSRQAPPKRAS